MLSNCEEMLVIPPTTNEWTQTQMIEDHKVVSMASSGNRVMEKPGQELLQQQQQALKCPRCDSSNTKFCYYNNYSLSQPRHFCKACKRYWTRGGTLRNVPVGGGCRKNKRLKRQNSSSVETTTASPPSSSTPNSATATNSNPPSHPHIDNNIASTSNHINPLFYGLPTNNNSCDAINHLPFSGLFSSSRVSSSGYDLHPHLNGLGGLGFSSGIMSSEASDSYNNGYRNNGGFGSSNNTFLSAYNSIFGGSSSNSTPTTPVMASLLSSTLLQQKLLHGGVKHSGLLLGGNNNTFQGLAPLGEGAVMTSKEVKGEEAQEDRLEWNSGGGGACQNNQIDHHHVSMSDPSLYWNAAATTALGANWSDQTNIGPSVTSLI